MAKNYTDLKTVQDCLAYAQAAVAGSAKCCPTVYQQYFSAQQQIQTLADREYLTTPAGAATDFANAKVMLAAANVACDQAFTCKKKQPTKPTDQTGPEEKLIDGGQITSDVVPDIEVKESSFLWWVVGGLAVALLIKKYGKQGVAVGKAQYTKYRSKKNPCGGRRRHRR